MNFSAPLNIPGSSILSEQGNGLRSILQVHLQEAGSPRAMSTNPCPDDEEDERSAAGGRRQPAAADGNSQ